ncbi:hypothetical protein PR202_ga28551 [Eleusine coracana subsp. coracana]|uniref:F-box domain-containing protein n=1 Tax=Eleusine coracana subsp. coracana TaxID=191504 RepID=A0AAV5DJ37_ELECO|nr:hypothetical protein PR202_ga28551 [Eleusine coracana subsp. coracana]
MTAPASPLLLDELVEEVLFRIPPDDPMSLIRATLVCKRWRRIIRDRGFHHRFREFHRAAPMLGVLCNSCYITYRARFVPTSSFRSPHAIISNKNNVADARHGRVLLHSIPHGQGWGNKSFAIWDPIKDQTTQLPEFEQPYVGYEDSSVAAVLCANSNNGSCDHLHCQHGPFRIVFIGTLSNGMFIYTYSSEDGAWNQHISSLRPHGGFNILAPNLLLGNSLHFVFGNSSDTKILKYDLASRDMSVIPTPPTCFHESQSCVVLMATEEDELGCGRTVGRSVHLWSSRHQQATLDEADAGGWELVRVMDDELPRTVLPASLVGFTNNGVNRYLFIRTTDGIFAYDLKSQKTRTICKDNGIIFNAFPYMSFYPF